MADCTRSVHHGFSRCRPSRSRHNLTSRCQCKPGFLLDAPATCKCTEPSCFPSNTSALGSLHACSPHSRGSHIFLDTSLLASAMRFFRAKNNSTSHLPFDIAIQGTTEHFTSSVETCIAGSARRSLGGPTSSCNSLVTYLGQNSGTRTSPESRSTIVQNSSVCFHEASPRTHIVAFGRFVHQIGNILTVDDGTIVPVLRCWRHRQRVEVDSTVRAVSWPTPDRGPPSHETEAALPAHPVKHPKRNQRPRMKPLSFAETLHDQDTIISVWVAVSVTVLATADKTCSTSQRWS